MHLLELAAQNVRGFSPSTRVTIPPGYVAVLPPGQGSVALGDLALAILYADGRGEDARFAAQPGQPGKVALTLLGNDQQTYRLVRQLGGAGILQRLDKASGAFAEVSRDPAEMVQYLRGQAGLPTRTVFEQLYTLATGQLPSRRKPKALAGKGLAAQSPQQVVVDPVQAKAKLAELAKELELSKQIDQLQFRQDGLASQMFGLEEKLRGTDGLQEALKQAEEAWQAAPTLEAVGLTADFLTRLERYPAAAQKHEEALARLESEREAEADAATATAIAPLYRDARFGLGVAAGVGCLVAGALLEGSWRYLALLDVPAFGFAALVALKWVDDLQDVQRVGRKEGMLAAREKKLRDDFEGDASSVKKALAALGVDSPQEAIDLLGRKALLQQKVEDFAGQLEQARADPDFARAARNHAALKRETEAISEQLQAMAGGYFRDHREVEREMARVRESLAPPSAPAQAKAPEPTEPLEDPTPALMAMAAEQLQLDVQGLAAQVKDRFSQYLAVLTDRRCLGGEVDHQGRGFALTAKGPVAVPALPPHDVDLFYLGLRLVLAEKLSHRGPLLIDGGLEVLEAAKHPVLGRMLKHLGSLTQVLYVAAPASAATAADATLAV